MSYQSEEEIQIAFKGHYIIELSCVIKQNVIPILIPILIPIPIPILIPILIPIPILMPFFGSADP